MDKLTPIEKITKAKISLYNEQPFFSYIVNHMVLIEDKKIPTMGVDRAGNCYYNSSFVEKLSDKELKTVVCHEALHCALIHLKRLKHRDANIWNYAADLAVNTMLKNNKFVIPEGCIVADYSNEYNIPTKKKITDVDKKTAEMLYNELYDMTDKLPARKNGDIHMFDSEDKEESNTSPSSNGTEWGQVITEASHFAKQRGKLPAGMERMIDKILNKKLNWKQMLYKYITNELAYDYTYSRPSRRTISTGLYLPSVQKENIKIMTAIDTSGSISHKELSIFLGEIYKITKSFNNLELEVMFHDTVISSHNKFTHGNLHKVLTLKPTGGGGTSHTEVFEYAKKNRANILICFTDGMSDIEQCVKLNNTLFVLTTDYKPPFGKSVFFDKLDLG